MKGEWGMGNRKQGMENLYCPSTTLRNRAVVGAASRREVWGMGNTKPLIRGGALNLYEKSYMFKAVLRPATLTPASGAKKSASLSLQGRLKPHPYWVAYFPVPFHFFFIKLNFECSPVISHNWAAFV
jgi:hypothetical protein